MKELVVDAFAGGGGASTGIRMALGRDPDIALNHDRYALAMHRANHPSTRHMLQDVATVDSVSMCAGLPIGMLWMSPDCTDHSKAKGAAPRREAGRTTRGIGWAIVGWIKALPAWQRPRVVFLENVEEFVDWGPLLANGKRCPVRKGSIFDAFVDAWRALGFGKIEWRIRRAWKRGAGTIRRRLYMIMRRDGEDIVWPEPTHGNPNDAEDLARINAGELLPWVTAADSIDFSLPIPSIFDSREEIKRTMGLTAVRPLADKTQARIAKGVSRHVLNALRPYLVKVNHTARNGEARDRAADMPLTTLTLKRDDALVLPHVAYAQQGGGTREAGTPIHTITASPKDQNQVVSAFLVPRYGERAGQEPRSRAVDVPGATPVPDGNEGSLVVPVLVGCGGRAGQSGPRPGDSPILTQTAKPDLCLAAVSLSRQFGASIGSAAVEPVGTITAGGGGKTALLAAFVAQHNIDGRRADGINPGRDIGEPVSTITTTGAQQGLVAAHMLTLRGSDRRDSAATAPLRTQSAGGTHDAVVHLPLLTVYYGSETDGGGVTSPLRTDTVRDRFGLLSAVGAPPPFGPEHEARAREVAAFLRAHGCWDGGEVVTLDVDGTTYVIVDIRMRMLTPRERYNAQGFPRDYIIDYGVDETGAIIRFNNEQQGHMCGNSVCPPEAAALVAANYRPREVQAPRRRDTAQASMFLEAAE